MVGWLSFCSSVCFLQGGVDRGGVYRSRRLLGSDGDVHVSLCPRVKTHQRAVTREIDGFMSRNIWSTYGCKPVLVAVGESQRRP